MVEVKVKEVEGGKWTVKVSWWVLMPVEVSDGVSDIWREGEARVTMRKRWW